MNDRIDDIAAIGGLESIPTILQIVCDTTGMGFAALARVTESRWTAYQVLDRIDFGLKPGGELPLETTICNEIRAMRREVVIDHAAIDPDYRAHPTPLMYGFQSYISVPIILPDGEMFGTLCAIDPEPRQLRGSAAVGMFRLFAQLIAFQIDAENKLNNSQTALNSARADLFDAETGSGLREQFIAVLGHDLRNPLAAIDAGRRMLAREHDDPKSVRVLRLMGESIDRMSGLISNVMDFARGRLGGGIGLDRSRGQRIEPLLAQVVNEIKASHPDRAIETHFDLATPIDVDHTRLGQLFSNLLGNAILHGDADQPIMVRAEVADGQFELAVANGGDPIAPDVLKRLFQPFARGEVRPNMEGLGLGLYIAGQIAQAHGGKLDVTSDPSQTCFTFRMPVA